MARDNPWTAHYLTAAEILKDYQFWQRCESFEYECKKYPDIKTSYAYLDYTHPHNLFLK